MPRKDAVRKKPGGGCIDQSLDGGDTWTHLPALGPAPFQGDIHPVTPNSVVYWFATHREVPDVIAAASLYGYVYISTDGGNA